MPNTREPGVHVRIPAARQRTLFETLPPTTTNEALTRLSARGWDTCGTYLRHGATMYRFRHAGTGDMQETAEGELPYWCVEVER